VDSESICLYVYYYVDNKGNQHGSVDEYKTQRMAEQNYCEEIHKIDISLFKGHLMGKRYDSTNR